MTKYLIRYVDGFCHATSAEVSGINEEQAIRRLKMEQGDVEVLKIEKLT